MGQHIKKFPIFVSNLDIHKCFNVLKKYSSNKKSVYLDTSMISYLVDKREEIKTFTDITMKWWNSQRKFYKVVLSPEVVVELERGEYPGKMEAIKIAIAQPMLKRVPNIIEIAEIYIKQFLMPKEFQGDAMHLAYASYYEIDFLLTWNCKHLANANKKIHIRTINTRLNLFIPEIITPLELFKE